MCALFEGHIPFSINSFIFIVEIFAKKIYYDIGVKSHILENSNLQSKFAVSEYF